VVPAGPLARARPPAHACGYGLHLRSRLNTSLPVPANGKTQTDQRLGRALIGIRTDHIRQVEMTIGVSAGALSDDLDRLDWRHLNPPQEGDLERFSFVA
jgi:hypothetical protein